MKIEFDEGYSFGQGCFETIKVIAGKALFLDLHYKRLRKSAHFFALSCPSFSDWETQIYDFIQQQKEKDFALKFLLSPKNQLLLLREDPYCGSEKTSWKLGFSSFLRLSTSPLHRHKSLCYYENILIREEARQKTWNEAIVLNERQEICEGAFSNLFFIQGEKIFTPSLSSGLLAGTMRQYLLEHYPIEEKTIFPEDLRSFDACFVSNALLGVNWVSQIEEISYTKSPLYDEIARDLHKIGF